VRVVTLAEGFTAINRKPLISSMSHSDWVLLMIIPVAVPFLGLLGELGELQVLKDLAVPAAIIR
jgi:hypothetical protein